MGEGELNVATTGNLLRSERERQGWTLQEVSVAIHIKIEYLQALEMDQYDCIPGEVFVKGFIRCYASFLGISGEPLVSVYKKKGITIDLSLIHISEPTRQDRPSRMPSSA